MENALEVLGLSTAAPSSFHAAQLSTLQQDASSQTTRFNSSSLGATADITVVGDGSTVMEDSLERRGSLVADSTVPMRAPAAPYVREVVRYYNGNREVLGYFPHYHIPGPAGRGDIQPLGESTNAADSALAASGGTMMPLVPRAGLAGASGDGSFMPAKENKRRRTAFQEGSLELEDGQRCCICSDPWTSQGHHRICTLLCGHLFGQSCIERWLKEKRSCPQCGAKVGPKNSNRIIPLFLNTLVAQDNGELETTRKLLEEEKQLRKQSEREKVRLAIHNESLKDQLSRLLKRTASAEFAQVPTIAQKAELPLRSSIARIPTTMTGGAGIGGGVGAREGIPAGGSSSITTPMSRGCTISVPSLSQPSFPTSSSQPSSISSGMGRTPASQTTPFISSPPTVMTAAAAAVASVSTSLVSQPTSQALRTGACDPYYSGRIHAPMQQQQQQQQLQLAPLDTSHAVAASGPIAIDWAMSRPLDSESRRDVANGGATACGEWALGNEDGRGVSSISMGGGTAAAASTLDCRSSDVRYDPLLSKELRSGRVVTFAGGGMGALLVSQESTATHYGARGTALGHGVTKFSLVDLRHYKHIGLHRGQVRDVKVKSDQLGPGFMLTTAFDRTLKVSDLRTDSVVIEYSLDGDGWSCQWSATDSNQMFAGIVDSSRYAAVHLFDLRSTARAVRKLRAAGGQHQPVHSICHTEEDQLVCATVCGVWAWTSGTKLGMGDNSMNGGSSGVIDDGNQEGSATQLQIQPGACCSLSQLSEASRGTPTRRFLVSTRGTASSHAVYALDRASPQRNSVSLCGDDAIPGQPEALGTHPHSPQGVAMETLQVIGRNCGDQVAQSGLALPPTSGAGLMWNVAARFASGSRLWRRLPVVAQGHQSQNTLSRSLLWKASAGAGLLIAGGDEATNQPWIWDAATGEIRHRLPANNSPVLDVASYHGSFPGRGLFAAVSQGDVRLYQTFTQC